jgi:O-antigen ligase
VFRPDWKVWGFAGGLILSCLLIPIGMEARTGLVCAAFLAVIMLRSVRYKFLIAGVGALALLAAMPFLPQSFTERMGTLTNTQGDESASTRVQVWKWTLEYAGKNPWGGGFAAYRGNSFTYFTAKQVGQPPNVRIEYEQVTDKGRAYHSSYFEMLGEQGWFGLAAWLWLMLLGLWHMERIRWIFARREDGKASWQYGMATALQQSQAVYLVGSLFVGIAFQPFCYMLVGLQCGLWSYIRRTTKEPQKASFRRAPGEPVAA